MFVLVLLYLSLAIWLYLLAWHGRVFLSKEPFFWSNKLILENIYKYNLAISKNTTQQVCILVPARNEEKIIRKTLRSILEQKNTLFEILLIDDQSDDRTIEYSKEIFKLYKFKKYKIIKSEDLPRGWSGKVWALNQGIEEAIKNKKNKFLLFLDADIIIEKHLLSNLLSILKNKRLEMISIMAKLNCSSFWEKILVPPFIYFFQKIYPFNIVNSPKKKLAAAAGGCIFCNINVFRKKNIFKLIKDKLIDDCNLAKQIKKEGAIWLGLSNKVISIRKYDDLKSIWRMVSRCAYEQLNNSLVILFISILLMIVVYFSWVIGLYIALNTQSIIIYFLSLIIFLISSIIMYPTINFYKLNPIYCLFIPISAGLYMMMTLSSSYNYYFNNGNYWKGRNY